ncbi:MAG TPA: adenylyl-sulfate kinase [Candidatus Deferrimicrobiaceae bacterium]
MPSERLQAFAVWLTGLPASGKSTLARALSALLAARGVRVVVLESDDVRRLFTPKPRYDAPERDRFYGALADLARLLAADGVPVLVAATANLRAYRDRARAGIPRFLEVFVDCPLPVCRARDPKGIYRRADAGSAPNVPGVSAAYEPPLRPEVVVDGARDPAGKSARAILSALASRGFLAGRTARGWRRGAATGRRGRRRRWRT